MTRLYERLTQHGFRPVIAAPAEYSRRIHAVSVAFWAEVRKINPTILVIDNVADYYWQGSDKDDWAIERGDFPCLAPPWPLAFMEYPAPAQITTHKGSESFDSSCLGKHFGVLLHSWDLDQPQSGFQGLPGVPRALQLLPGATMDRKELELADEKVQWGQQASVFAELSEGDIALIGSFCWLLAIDGSFVAITDKGFPFLPPFGVRLETEELQQLGHNCRTFLHPALLALSFIHCRNTQLIDHAPSPAVIQAARDRHGHVPVSFKTLEIEPVKKILAHQGQAGEKGLRMALHICRGHFKDYRNSKGLFGKHKELYWWDQHVRGSLEEGVVLKEYVAPAPPAGEKASDDPGRLQAPAAQDRRIP